MRRLHEPQVNCCRDQRSCHTDDRADPPAARDVAISGARCRLRRQEAEGAEVAFVDAAVAELGGLQVGVEDRLRLLAGRQRASLDLPDVRTADAGDQVPSCRLCNRDDGGVRVRILVRLEAPPDAEPLVQQPEFLVPGIGQFAGFADEQRHVPAIAEIKNSSAASRGSGGPELVIGVDAVGVERPAEHLERCALNVH